jgi:uncharacterized membrane protein YczE
MSTPISFKEAGKRVVATLVQAIAATAIVIVGFVVAGSVTAGAVVAALATGIGVPVFTAIQRYAQAYLAQSDPQP